MDQSVPMWREIQWQGSMFTGCIHYVILSPQRGMDEIVVDSIDPIRWITTLTICNWFLQYKNSSLHLPRTNVYYSACIHKII